MRDAWARLRAWRRRHPRLTVGGLVVLVALLAGASYQGGRYFWARSHFRAAQQAVDRHAWEEAREHLAKYRHSWPDSAAAHLLAARAARRLELLDEAEAHLDACQRLRGGDTQAAKVERALLRVHGGDLAGAEDFLRACVARDDPDAVEILDILSAALILSYRVDEARQCLDDLLRRQPDHFHALVRRAWTARSAGADWYPQAVEYLEKALALRPDADAVRLSLAELQVALARDGEAREHFERLRERQPENPSVRFGLARCHAAAGEAERARELLDRLIADYPGDWKALGERGGLALQLDRPAEAEEYLRRAVALAGPDLPLLTRLADCLVRLGKADEAREFRERADRLKADFRRADQLGTLIREQSPHDANLRHELGCVLYRVGKPRDALHWFRTALEKDPKHRPTHQSLAELFEKAGDFERAAFHRQALAQPDRGR